MVLTVLCENINTVKKSIEALLEDGKEASVDASMPCHQNIEQHHYFCKKLLFKIMAWLKYLEMTTECIIH
jgi:hypothetical protein